MKESNIQSLVLMKATELGCRMFRINVGQGWTGNKIIKQGKDVLIKDARPFRVGVPVGFHDTAGFTPIVITQDMVGKTVAVFTTAEIKTSTGRATKEQLNFLNHVRENGGISGVVRSPLQFAELIHQYNNDEYVDHI
jgi:ribosomal protein S19